MTGYTRPTFLRVALVVASAAAAGCLTSPNDGEAIPDHTAPVLFQGELTNPADSILIQCEDLHDITPSGGYYQLDVTTLSYGGVGSFTGNGQTVYPVTAEVALPPLCWLDDLGGRPTGPHAWFALLHPIHVTPSGPDSHPVAVYNAAGLDCIEANLNRGPIAAGFMCKLPNQTGIRITSTR